MIQACLGKNGGGKGVTLSHTMVLPSWRAGRPVVSNYRLFPERLGLSKTLYRPLTSWTMVPRLGVTCWHCRRSGMERPQKHVWGRYRYERAMTQWAAMREHLAELDGQPCEGAARSVTGNRPCTLLLDEVTSVLPSRQGSDMPVELQRMLHQFRKPDVWFGWAAVAWARCDLIAREATVRVVEASPVLPGLTGRRQPGTAWVEHRVFRMEHFDAYAYNEADEGGRLDALEPSKVKYLWRPRDVYAAQTAYDTKEGVELLDNVQCPRCGGKLPRKLHDPRKCDGQPVEAPVVVEAGTAMQSVAEALAGAAA